MTDDVILVPSGTIHAIGAGLVIAEIQQRSDATFRLFDYGRKREIQLDNAVAAASAGPAAPQAAPSHFTDGRSLLAVDSHFVLERFDLPPRSSWSFGAERETWLFVVSGSARIGSFDMALAGVAFVEDEQVRIEVGQSGMKALVAYTGPAVATTCCAASIRPPRIPLSGHRSVRPFNLQQRPPCNACARKRIHDVTAPDCPHRKSPAAPVRHRHVHRRSACGDLCFAPEFENLCRGDDGPWSCLRLSTGRALSGSGRDDRRLCEGRRFPKRFAFRRRLSPTRIRNLRRRSGRPHHGDAFAPAHADRHDASYGSRSADSDSARGAGPVMAASAKVVVMSKKGQEILRSVYAVPSVKIAAIPHGIPDVPFFETHHAKTCFGFTTRPLF